MTRCRTAAEFAACWPAGPEFTDSFWLREETLRFLGDEPQGFGTEGLLVTHEPSGRRVLFSLQQFEFSAAGYVSEAAKGTTSRYDLRRRLLSNVTFRAVCVGQLLTSGPYGLVGLDSFSAEEQATLLSALADTLLAAPDNFDSILLKDLTAPDTRVAQTLRANGYYDLPVDPVMELNLSPAWKTIDDYLADITSKYRVRYRRARGKFAGLTRRSLSALEVRDRRQEIHELYRETSTGAAFNTTSLTVTYFPWLADVQEKANGWSGVTGYFDGLKLVAFTSTVDGGPVLQAHFLGMTDSYKTSHHLYHNILFDLLNVAIERGKRKIDYGRTALEIKSSVGATGANYACLLKAKNPVTNWLIPKFTPAVYAGSDWVERQPFRKGE